MLDIVVYNNVTVFDLIIVLIIIIIGMTIAKMVTINLRRTFKDKIERSQLKILQKVVNFIIIIITIIIVLPFLGVNFTGLVLAVGILGFVFAFASQSIFSNLIAGIFLFVERPMKIGDVVNIDTKEGVVEDIKLLSTRIRGHDGYIFRIPNEKVFTNTITNFFTTPARRFEYVIGIRYEDDAPKAIGIIENLIEDHPLILKNPAHQAFVDNLGDNSVNIIVRIWSPRTEWYNVKMEFLWKIKSSLEEHGIEIPFPQQTLWFADELKLKGDKIK